MRLPGLVIFILARALAADPVEFFETRVRPVLANNCFACHTTSKLGGLQVDSKEHLLQGGKSGAAIVPGKPEKSVLIRAITYTDEHLKMPPGGKLKEQEIADLTTWVKLGAAWPETAPVTAVKAAPGYVITPEQRAFWAFQPIRKVAPPMVQDASRIQSPIDQFVFARLEAAKLKPAKPADKQTLIRRATFDLTGLPPTPEEIDAFLKDSSPKAFAKVIDRLLASPRYGERWGRFWLDVARFGEDDVRGLSQETYPNAWRYRDWVIQAFNEDMPYDLFVKAQIAGDLMPAPSRDKLITGTGFFGLGPWYYDINEPPQARADERHDRVDALTRGFLGLTVACARCHNHKYDPISMQDYYGLAGVFGSSQYYEYPLAPEPVVAAYKEHQKKIANREAALNSFLETEAGQMAEIQSRKISKYMLAAWKVLSGPKLQVRQAAEQGQLDQDAVERWVKYLGSPQKEYPYLKGWNELLASGGTPEQAKKIAEEFQALVLAIRAEKKEVDEENHILLANSRRATGDMIHLPNGFSSYEEFCPGCQTAIRPFERSKYLLLEDLFGQKGESEDRSKKEAGLLRYSEDRLERFLSSEWKAHVASMKAEIEQLKKNSPQPYPYLHGMAESRKPADLKLNLRGSPYNLGEPVPRRFLAVLSKIEPAPLNSGSGRLQLAEAIANHPLTARVMVNRIWQHHFGRGIVATPSNFGQVGERPSHPELLEHLAGEFTSHRYSIKALHREIMLSAAYQLSTEYSEHNFAQDPDNHLVWRANRNRLDAEALRDSMLFVAGDLDTKVGGPSADLSDGSNTRRTVYGKASRFRVNGYLALFDFPDPSITSERRNVTNVPLQRLFFMNSDLTAREAANLVRRLRSGEHGEKAKDADKIRDAYRLLYGREATDREIQFGLEFLESQPRGTGNSPSAWEQYAQVLLSSNEFAFVN